MSESDIQQLESELESDLELQSDIETTQYNVTSNSNQYNKEKKLMTMYSSMVRKESGCSSSASRRVYAVKRIPRERSMYDNPLLYEVFNEITCLQLLAGNGGVSILSSVIFLYYLLCLCMIYCFYLLFIV